ncbi:transposase family protein [Treponema sp. TIM-1]|uniref:integrase catalytic domain-containing protein n=1 Tax=Treponema sp. TIM-1 TaxID=2898417 RepID=UPI0039819340
MSSRKAIVKNTYREYQQAGKKGRGEILDRLVSVTGMNRDYLATLLGRYGKEGSVGASTLPGKRKPRPEGKRGGRPPKYGEQFVKILTDIWYDHGRPCGKLLIPMIRGMIGFLEADGGYGITAEMRVLLEEVSPAEADLLLAGARKKLEIRGVSTTRAAQTPLRSQIPVRTGFNRETLRPGFFACDTVAHCGGSASGQFCKTLTVTDVFSGWIEERALVNAANRWVFEAFSAIAGGLPFPLQGAHYDNGMEFINEPLLEWCLKRHIEPTRTRPYHKNDNCYAEQKNFDAVRKTVGYFRFDTPAEYAALAEVYRFLCPLYNYWYPSFKLVSKEKQADGRYKKIYEKDPRTPYERLLESPDISEECKVELRRRQALNNPVALNRSLNEAVEHLLKIHREKGYTGNTPCQGGGGQVPAA